MAAQAGLGVPVKVQKDVDVTLANEHYWQAFDILRSFEDRLGITEFDCPIPVHGTDTAGSTTEAVPTRMALLFLEIVCRLRDVAWAFFLLVPSLTKDDGSPVESLELKQLGNFQAPILKFLLESLGNIDKSIHTPEARMIETSGFSSLQKPSIALVRAWRESAARGAKIILDMVLKLAVRLLEQADKDTRAAVPVWQSLFANEMIHMENAVRMMKGTCRTLIKVHNNLFDRMQEVAELCKVLQISPDVKNHPITCGVVAVISTTLAEVKKATVVAEGIDILSIKETEVGAKAAKDFYGKRYAEYKSLPACFWQEFESAKAYATAVPSSVAENADPSVKSEISLSTSVGSARSCSGATSSTSVRIASSPGSTTGGKAAWSPPATNEPSTPASHQKRGLKRSATGFPACKKEQL